MTHPTVLNLMQRVIPFIEETINTNTAPKNTIIQSGDYIMEIKLIKKHDAFHHLQEWIENCPCCGQRVSRREVRLGQEMIGGLIKAFEYCKQQRIHEFSFTDIKDQLNQLEYSHFNYLVRFGLAYKIKRGRYRLPMKRVSDFLHWAWTVSESYLDDPTKKEGEIGKRIMSEKRITVDQVKGVEQHRQETNGKFTTYYVTPEESQLF